MRAKIGLAYDDTFLLHGTDGHIESPGRLRAIMSHLDKAGWLSRLVFIQAEPAPPDKIAWLHDVGYIDEVQLISEQGGGYLDLDTVATSETYRAAALAVGACQHAAQEVTNGGVDAAFCLVRPPGHHALPSRGMGFCFFNNAALAAEAVIRNGLRRVAIVDWDLHHGNGTQEIFYHRGDVLYFSIHQAYYAGGGGVFYPGTGTVDEVGVDAGFGKNINIPLPGGATGEDYLLAFREVLLPMLNLYKPEIVIVSAGFDAHHRDPLGQMLLTASTFHAMTTMLAEAARTLCQGKLLFVLEGGYDHQALAWSVDDCLRALAGENSSHPEDVAPVPAPHQYAAVCRYLEHAVTIHKHRLGF